MAGLDSKETNNCITVTHVALDVPKEGSRSGADIAVPFPSHGTSMSKISAIHVSTHLSAYNQLAYDTYKDDRPPRTDILHTKGYLVLSAPPNDSGYDRRQYRVR